MWKIIPETTYFFFIGGSSKNIERKKEILLFGEMYDFATIKILNIYFRKSRKKPSKSKRKTTYVGKYEGNVTFRQLPRAFSDPK